MLNIVFVIDVFDESALNCPFVLFFLLKEAKKAPMVCMFIKFGDQKLILVEMLTSN